MITLNLQIASEQTETAEALPESDQFQHWIEAALRHVAPKAAESNPEITIRIVDETESAELNETYRQKPKPTNILSFPFEMPPEIAQEITQEMDQTILGDLVICAPVVAREVKEQGKNPEAHWAHLTVHGVLHLLGWDHIDPNEAEAMEQQEREILASLGIADPYAVTAT